MAAIQRQLQLLVSHYEIGDYIEYGWFRGEVVGINANSLQQTVRVCEVIRSAPNRSIGSHQRVPFNLGTECTPPKGRQQ